MNKLPKQCFSSPHIMKIAQSNIQLHFTPREKKISSGSILLLLSNCNCSLQLNNGVITQTVTDHHMFYISSTFDNDLHHQFLCTGAQINIQSASVLPKSIPNIAFSFQFIYLFDEHTNFSIFPPLVQVSLYTF